MNRILMAGAAVLLLSAAMISPVNADEGVEGKMTPVADEIPAPSALKVNAGVAEGHKSALEVYKKAIAAAKAGEMDKLKSCFNPNNLDYIDEESWESSGEGEAKLTYLGAMAVVLKGYADEGEERAQGAVGDYAIVAVKNGEAVNLVKCVRIAKWTEKGEEKDKNWYLSTYYASEYRVDYAAAGVKAIREAIEKGDVEKLKEFLDPWQTQVLDLIAGVQEGIDPYALLMKRLQMIGGGKDSKIKPTILLDRSGTRLCYWFHQDKTDAAAASDTFIVLQFWEDWDWQTDKKFTNVKLDIGSTTEFHKNGTEAFKNWVQDWSW
jgi:hypothetical protein